MNRSAAAAAGYGSDRPRQIFGQGEEGRGGGGGGGRETASCVGVCVRTARLSPVQLPILYGRHTVAAPAPVLLL